MDTTTTFFSVLVIKPGIYESRIIDEQHFPDEASAEIFADTMNGTGYVSIIMELDY